MKSVTIVTLLCVALFLLAGMANGQEKNLYSALLIAAKPASGDAEDIADLKQAEQSVSEYLKNNCIFYDQEQLAKMLDNLYKQNPNMDPTNLENKARELKVPARLMILVDAVTMKIEKDADFQNDVSWHTATVKVRVVDNGKRARMYADTTEPSPRPAFMPTSGRDSRNRAIDMAVQELVRKLLSQLENKKSLVKEFDFRAMRLSQKQSAAMYRVLGQFGGKVKDLEKASDEGMTASIDYAEGIASFKDRLEDAMQKQGDLQEMVCDPNWQGVWVYPRGAKIDDTVEAVKFDGRVVLARDEKYLAEAKLAADDDNNFNLRFLHDKLQEQLQRSCKIYDATALLEKFRQDNIALNITAIEDPSEYLNQKFNLSTHIVYYWVRMRAKKDASYTYYFADIGIRMVRNNDGRELGKFTVVTENDLQGGVGEANNQGDETARKRAMDKLARLAVSRLLNQLRSDNPVDFRRPAATVNIKANLTAGDIAKLSGVIEEMQNRERVICVEEAESGRGYLNYQITFPKFDTKREKQKTLDQATFRQRLNDFCQEAGMPVRIQENANQILITAK
jgi:hypothetical protein